MLRKGIYKKKKKKMLRREDINMLSKGTQGHVILYISEEMYF